LGWGGRVGDHHVVSDVDILALEVEGRLVIGVLTNIARRSDVARVWTDIPVALAEHD